MSLIMFSVKSALINKISALTTGERNKEMIHNNMQKSEKVKHAKHTVQDQCINRIYCLDSQEVSVSVVIQRI